jgi:hypothetical protein
MASAQVTPSAGTLSAHIYRNTDHRSAFTPPFAAAKSKKRSAANFFSEG